MSARSHSSFCELSARIKRSERHGMTLYASVNLDLCGGLGV